MAADKKILTGYQESCESHDSSYAVGFFCCPPPYYAVWLNHTVFGYFVQTMPNPRSGTLRTLHCCQTQTDKDGASIHKIDFLTYY